ncbi:diguanylate cyclase DgcN [Escherichia coli]
MMDNDNSLNKRPTFKRALRNISMTSIFITMMLIWLLLSVTSVLTLKQYAQKNLALTAATMTYSLEAAVVFADGPAATETLAALGQQGQFSTAEVRDKQQNILASWHYTRKDPGDTFSNFISHWLFPAPIIQPIRHNGETIGEVRLTARDSSISHFIWFSLAVLTGCILLASGIAITLTRHLHNGLVEALKNITDVVHDVRSNRNFSRRVSEERIAEFHRFALDFNSLLDEMEEWQLRLQAKNAQLLRTALHDPLTGLRHKAYRLGGDEFAMVLYDVQSESEVQQICSALTQIFNLPFDLHNGHQTTMTLSIGYAMTIEHASAEKLQELADHNMYQAKHQRAEKLVR